MRICGRTCVRKRVHPHISNIKQEHNPFIENNCQNSPQVSTHNIINANMPHGSLLVGTPTTPITLNYEYNWEERGVLAITFSYGELALLLRRLKSQILL